VIKFWKVKVKVDGGGMRPTECTSSWLMFHVKLKDEISVHCSRGVRFTPLFVCVSVILHIISKTDVARNHRT